MCGLTPAAAASSATSAEGRTSCRFTMSPPDTSRTVVVIRTQVHRRWRMDSQLSVMPRNFSITPCTPFGIGVMSGRDQRSRAVGVAHVRPAIHQRPNGRRRALCPEGAPWRAPTAAGSPVNNAACTGLLRSYDASGSQPGSNQVYPMVGQYPDEQMSGDAAVLAVPDRTQA